MKTCAFLLAALLAACSTSKWKRSKIHNRVLLACMRERGYERQEEHEASGRIG
ncbi:MAG TPA: hypothetical protein VNC62_03755 [Burkholderiales bacterium]|nr:hypothetical protein [Burkholderiales bacterium]